jgi:site-specific DNA-methyltransferase (adenine-specific)
MTTEIEKPEKTFGTCEKCGRVKLHWDHACAPTLAHVLIRRTPEARRAYIDGTISALRRCIAHTPTELVDVAPNYLAEVNAWITGLEAQRTFDTELERPAPGTYVAEALAGSRRWVVMEGEMLEGLRTLPTASIDALITDPPYSSGGAFRGDRMLDTNAKYVNSENAGQRPDFAGDNRDQRSFMYWCALWLAECLRIAKPGAICAVFTDWRQLPSVTDAIQAGGWVWRGVVPWDKTEATRPQMGRPRAQCEYVVFGSAGALDKRESVGVLPGLIRAIVNPDEKLHIAGKPIAVMSELARWCVPGGVILDPFSGSASTGVGALRQGRRFIGIEVDPYWAKLSVDRMEAEASGSSYAQAKAGQAAFDLGELASAPPRIETLVPGELTFDTPIEVWQLVTAATSVDGKIWRPCDPATLGEPGSIVVRKLENGITEIVRVGSVAFTLPPGFRPKGLDDKVVISDPAAAGVLLDKPITTEQRADLQADIDGGLS